MKHPYAIAYLLAAACLTLATAAAAQCIGGIGTVTLPPPTNGNQIWVDIDVDGNPGNELRIRRVTLTNGDEYVDVYSTSQPGNNCTVSIGNFQMANAFPRTINNDCTVAIDIWRFSNGAVTRDAPVTHPFFPLKINLSRRLGWIEMTNVTYGGLTGDWTVDIVERAFQAPGFTQLRTGNCASMGPVSNSVPVTLVDFAARRADDQRVELTWATASELDNAGFEILHWDGDDAADAPEVIGYVPGAGTSNATQSYRFTDRAARASAALYQLRQLDHDGTATDSEVVAVSAAASKADVSGSFYVFDALGTRRASVFLEAGRDIGMQVAEQVALPPGAYFLSDAAGASATLRLLLQ